MTLTDPIADPGADYGEVFTRRWVVEMILDFVGYTSDHDLAERRLVEPSCGTGAFLIPVVDRLVECCKQRGRDLRGLRDAVRAFDLLDGNVRLARKAVSLRLHDAGLSTQDADELAARWIMTGDFLLHEHSPRTADYVVGNPPYIRLESVPPAVMETYRARCTTMRGRSDVYVGFIEQGLELLKPEGSLGFICADRWMRNQYGRNLRQMITERYAVDSVITMHDVDAFEDDVSAYPAVVVLRNGEQGRTVVADASSAFGERDAAELGQFVSHPRRKKLASNAIEGARLDRWFSDGDLWPTGHPSHLALVAELERRFPPLEDRLTGTRVGIGVATGCDDIFITKDEDLVETSRLLPLLQSSHVSSGAPTWDGTYLVNPWAENGLVDLDEFPRLRNYFRAHEARLRARHIAEANPRQWYRTIDRVSGTLRERPKLLLPDIKAASHPALDDGSFYPHHNLYFVVSDTWDLEVLGGLLLSDIANLFVGAYCVKMRGGCYRFQAQYMRRIRVPSFDVINKRQRRSLALAFETRDRAKATATACQVYGLPSLPALG